MFDVAPRQVKGESHLVVSIPYFATAPQFRRRGFAKLLLTHIKTMSGQWHLLHASGCMYDAQFYMSEKRRSRRVLTASVLLLT